MESGRESYSLLYKVIAYLTQDANINCFYLGE